MVRFDPVASLTYVHTLKDVNDNFNPTADGIPTRPMDSLSIRAVSQLPPAEAVQVQAQGSLLWYVALGCHRGAGVAPTGNYFSYSFRSVLYYLVLELPELISIMGTS